ncbi:SMI1/KNR4 family protein [uncultured Xanthomonas sp.]|uniref:SMI1/KNR4 family protein n=1 Tax=uncultured Xanthomonas sp. TaxID=152831 RepID=UPI0025CD52FF|nr:SMI1/KNR4 family protein [uncultured Xanthomonas sp.]
MTVSRNYAEEILASDNAWVAGGANPKQIAALEAALRVTFPTSYRLFLASAGGAAIGDNFVSGIIDDDPLSLGGGSLFGDTVNAREEQQLPAHLLVIQSDVDAPYCIDTSANPVRGEVPIVCYEPFNSVATRVAGSFDEWFSTFFLGRV